MQERNQRNETYVLFCASESSIFLCQETDGTYQASEIMLSKGVGAVIRLAGLIATRDISNYPSPSPVSKEHLSTALAKLNKEEDIVKKPSRIKKWFRRSYVDLIKTDYNKHNPAGPDFNALGMKEFWGKVALAAQSQHTEVDVYTLRTFLGVLK